MTSHGVFRYGPTINGSQIRRDGGTTQWWLIVECDPELGRYLRHLFSLSSYRTQNIQAPLWETHISVIRGDEPPNKTQWRRLDGEHVEFEYEFSVMETEGYFWTPVRCEVALQVREELGLPQEPEPPLHMTIGNIIHEMG